MIVIYSTGCPKCKVLINKLNAKNIEYSVFNDVDKMIKMGITNVPILEVDDVRMKFKEANNWINSME
jgi:hypothetical protein